MGQVKCYFFKRPYQGGDQEGGLNREDGDAPSERVHLIPLDKGYNAQYTAISTLTMRVLIP